MKGEQTLAKHAQKQKAIKNPNKVYKAGKLTNSTRFSSNRTDPKLLIVIGCVIFSILFAVILGNILGDKAHSSQNGINNFGSPSSIGAPSVDKTSPKLSLHAYFADMNSADPSISLSEQTGEARSLGNALYLEINNGSHLIYSSNKASELGYSQGENLLLSRLKNHFEYYNDYAVGLFRSDFSASLDNEARLKAQMNEALLLAEATNGVFDQIIIEFSGSISKQNAIYYQAYLLDLKLACPNIPIGIKLPYSFLVDSKNSGIVSQIFSISDFCAIDLGSQGVSELKESIEPLAYFTERYSAVIMLSASSESPLEERVSILEAKGIKSYIVK